jgi:hypothetical protein
MTSSIAARHLGGTWNKSKQGRGTLAIKHKGKGPQLSSSSAPAGDCAAGGDALRAACSHCMVLLLPRFPVSIGHGDLVHVRQQGGHHRVGGGGVRCTARHAIESTIGGRRRRSVPCHSHQLYVLEGRGLVQTGSVVQSGLIPFAVPQNANIKPASFCRGSGRRQGAGLGGFAALLLIVRNNAVHMQLLSSGPEHSH